MEIACDLFNYDAIVINKDIKCLSHKRRKTFLSRNERASGLRKQQHANNKKNKKKKKKRFVPLKKIKIIENLKTNERNAKEKKNNCRK